MFAGRLDRAAAGVKDDPLVRARWGADALPDRQALEHLRQLVHLAVNLGRTDTDAAGVERRVAAPVNDQPAVLGDLGPVAVPPRSGVALEIRGAVFRP